MLNSFIIAWWGLYFTWYDFTIEIRGAIREKPHKNTKKLQCANGTTIYNSKYICLSLTFINIDHNHHRQIQHKTVETFNYYNYHSKTAQYHTKFKRIEQASSIYVRDSYSFTRFIDNTFFGRCLFSSSFGPFLPEQGNNLINTSVVFVIFRTFREHFWVI